MFKKTCAVTLAALAALLLQSTASATDNHKLAELNLIGFSHEIIIEASPSEIWAALTTPEGLKKWIAPESNVSIELGGRYELFFWPDNPEDRGMEGTHILSYAPEEMLSYTGEIDGTWVVWRITPQASGTHVKVSCFGPKDSEQWHERSAYFEGAFPDLLERLTKSITTS